MLSLLGIGQDAYAGAATKTHVLMDYVKIFPTAARASSGDEVDDAQYFEDRLAWKIRKVLGHRLQDHVKPLLQQRVSVCNLGIVIVVSVEKHFDDPDR